MLAFASERAAHEAEVLLKKKMHTKEIKTEHNSVHLYIKNGERMMPGMLRALDAERMDVQNVTLSKPSLDDVFLKYTGRSLREDERE